MARCSFLRLSRACLASWYCISAVKRSSSKFSFRWFCAETTIASERPTLHERGLKSAELQAEGIRVEEYFVEDLVRHLEKAGIRKKTITKRSAMENWRIMIVPVVFLLLQHRSFQEISAVMQTAIDVQRNSDAVSAITKFVSTNDLFSKGGRGEDPGEEQEEALMAGFIFPTSIRTLNIDGPALSPCKSACSLMLQAIKDGEQIVAGIASQSPQLHSWSLKSLMVFPDLNNGKYRVWANCAKRDNRACYTDPREIQFEVTADAFEKENMIHLGRLAISARPLRGARDSEFDSIRQNRMKYARALERWRSVIVVAMVFIVVGAGLLLISYFTNENHR